MSRNINRLCFFNDTYFKKKKKNDFSGIVFSKNTNDKKLTKYLILYRNFPLNLKQNKESQAIFFLKFKFVGFV